MFTEEGGKHPDWLGNTIKAGMQHQANVSANYHD